MHLKQHTHNEAQYFKGMENYTFLSKLPVLTRWQLLDVHVRRAFHNNYYVANRVGQLAELSPKAGNSKSVDPPRERIKFFSARIWHCARTAIIIF